MFRPAPKKDTKAVGISPLEFEDDKISCQTVSYLNSLFSKFNDRNLECLLNHPKALQYLFGIKFKINEDIGNLTKQPETLYGHILKDPSRIQTFLNGLCSKSKEAIPKLFILLPSIHESLDITLLREINNGSCIDTTAADILFFNKNTKKEGLMSLAVDNNHDQFMKLLIKLLVDNKIINYEKIHLYSFWAKQNFEIVPKEVIDLVASDYICSYKRDLNF